MEESGVLVITHPDRQHSVKKNIYRLQSGNEYQPFLTYWLSHSFGRQSFLLVGRWVGGRRR